MKDYRVDVAIGNFAFYVQAWDEEDAREEAQKQLDQFVAVIQDVSSDFEETLEMSIADIKED